MLYEKSFSELYVFIWRHIGRNEQNNILFKNGAPGYDEINAWVLKIISSCVASPLVYLCNISLEQGIFPIELKLANVLPLYKADDPFVFNSYRPVSLLCVLSKVFEKVMYNRLIDYLETYKILVHYQFGFRKNHSSYMALMYLMDKLIFSMENKKHVIGLFLDFEKPLMLLILILCYVNCHIMVFGAMLWNGSKVILEDVSSMLHIMGYLPWKIQFLAVFPRVLLWEPCCFFFI